jgi:CYTH domain-containing protein
MIELEKTYLAKNFPEGLAKCDSKKIVDVYLPANRTHPVLRLRQNGAKYELTKKTPVADNDASRQREQTIVLDAAEFRQLSQLAGKRVSKIRYFYEYEKRTAEIDVFQEDLKGLVLVDFEFSASAEKDVFVPPDFCLADVTAEKFVAGGMICGKKYSDLAVALNKFGYKKLFL